MGLLRTLRATRDGIAAITWLGRTSRAGTTQTPRCNPRKAWLGCLDITRRQPYRCGRGNRRARGERP
jgi:hypothetical protein